MPCLQIFTNGKATLINLITTALGFSSMNYSPAIPHSATEGPIKRYSKVNET